MPFSIDNDLDIFINTLDALAETPEELLEVLRDRGITKYRIRTIKSGPMLECEIYPLWNTNQSKRVKRFRESRPEQKNKNRENVRKKMIRLLNGNFTAKDIWITTGYKGGINPPDMKAAKKDVINYLRRLQRYCDRNGLPKLKYVYVTEIGAKGKTHHHIVMNFPDRDIAERYWSKGNQAQARRLQPDDFGLEGMARYIAKDLNGQKSYGYSLNLYKPWEHATINDSRMTKRRAERIATGRIDPKTLFENTLYRDKGYIFMDMVPKTSQFVSGCYIYVRMRKEEQMKQ